MESIVPVQGRRRRHATPDLDDDTVRRVLATQQLDGVFASGAADEAVVTADELRVLVVGKIAVEDNHRDAGVCRPC